MFFNSHLSFKYCFLVDQLEVEAILNVETLRPKTSILGHFP